MEGNDWWKGLVDIIVGWLLMLPKAWRVLIGG